MLTKMPPLAKMYEAYSALADGRVTMGPDRAAVLSSDRAKTYTVRWQGDTYASDDNATYWQGYPGYPVIAVLMLQGRLPYDPPLTSGLAGVDWHALNARFRRDYDQAAASVLATLPQRDAITAAAQQAFQQLSRLDIALKRRL